MSVDFDVIDLGGGGSNGGSKNFGSGIELFMNTGNNERSTNSRIDMDEIKDFEMELNNLESDVKASSIDLPFESSLFGGNKKGNNDVNDGGIEEMDFDDAMSVGSASSGVRFNLGASTADISSRSKTWDGFTSSGGSNNYQPYQSSEYAGGMGGSGMGGGGDIMRLSKDEQSILKRSYIKKAKAHEKNGREIPRDFESFTLQEMRNEVEALDMEESKEQSIKMQEYGLKGVVGAIEWASKEFPVGVDLDGWGDQVEANIGEYRTIFGELHDEYLKDVKVSPWVKLFGTIVAGAVAVHFSNKMMGNMQNLDGILQQNPDVARSFQTAMMNTVIQGGEGGGRSALGSMMGNGAGAPDADMRNNISQYMSYKDPQVPVGRGPPPPIATQGPGAAPAPMRPGAAAFTRPDLRMAQQARSATMANGLPMHNPAAMRNAMEAGLSDGFQLPGAARPEPRSRGEMRGPARGSPDVTQFLSGIRTTTVNLADAIGGAGAATSGGQEEDRSTISAAEYEELMKSGKADANPPKKRGRGAGGKRNSGSEKQKPVKEVINLDL